MPARDEDLDVVDDVVQQLVRQVRGSSYRGRVLAGVDSITGINTLRVLRSIESRLALAEEPAILDVARDLDIEQSSASRAVTVAVDAGLVERVPSTADQRRARLDLTPRGRDALSAATANRKSLLREITRDWSDDDLGAFGRLARRLVAGYGEL
jgi:DNA-binding MarR family transcriptional regulator